MLRLLDICSDKQFSCLFLKPQMTEMCHDCEQLVVATSNCAMCSTINVNDINDDTRCRYYVLESFQDLHPQWDGK